MVFTNPQQITYEEQVERTGVLTRHLDAGRLRGAIWQAELQLDLLRTFAEGRRIFDFGCGAGALVHAALAEGWEAVGLDLNRGLVTAANAHWKFNALRTGTLEDFVRANEPPFDAIVSNQVFEHLQDPVSIGRQLVDLLNPRGCILIDVPNVNQPQEWISRGKTLDPTSHWCHFSVRTLSDLMGRIGCDVVYASAAPSLSGLYHRLGMGVAARKAAIWTKRVLPAIGTGVCVIGRKRD